MQETHKMMEKWIQLSYVCEHCDKEMKKDGGHGWHCHVCFKTMIHGSCFYKTQMNKDKNSKPPTISAKDKNIWKCKECKKRLQNELTPNEIMDTNKTTEQKRLFFNYLLNELQFNIKGSKHFDDSQD